MLISDFPDMGLEHHLGPDSSLVIDKNFEDGVMAISKNVPLSLQQQAAVVNLVVKARQGGDAAGRLEASTILEEQAGHEEESYAARVAKRLKVKKFENGVGREQYVNVEVIPGTSVNCERLFSLAKHILTDTRKNTLPILFEALIFLKVNRSLWDANTVGKAMGRTWEQHEEVLNCIDIDESTIGTCGGGASEITTNTSTITELVGVNDDDESDDREYF